MALIKIVHHALEAIDFCAPDVALRILRNTYARRLLSAGRTTKRCRNCSALASDRIVVRLRATIMDRGA
jgi:integrase/recombinase XerD